MPFLRKKSGKAHIIIITARDKQVNNIDLYLVKGLHILKKIIKAQTVKHILKTGYILVAIYSDIKIGSNPHFIKDQT